MSKKLVCYFSCTKTTQKYATKLSQDLGCDLYEIKPVKTYTKDDLNWQDENSRSSLEMSNPKARTELIKDLNNLSNYETILVGFPIWWYTAPRIINSFFESYDLSSKKVVIFATSGSSNMGQIVKQLQITYPQLNLIEGKVVNHISNIEYENWLKTIK